MSSNGTTVMCVTYLASCGLQRRWASALPHRRHEATWEGKLPAGEGHLSKDQAQGKLATVLPVTVGRWQQVAVACL